MKLRFISSLLIFISSYFPLALIVIIKDLDDKTFLPQHVVASLIIFFLFSLSCVVVIIAARSIKGGVPITALKVANKSGDMFTYTIPYMVSFYRFDLGDFKAVASLAVFMILMFVLTLRTQNQFINPVLAIAGYKLYDCQLSDNKSEFQGLVVSRTCLKSGDVCVLERLSHSLYFASNTVTKGGKNNEK